MPNNTQDFESFLRRREAAASAYVGGNPDPLDALVAKNFPASFFGPGGGVVRGAVEVASRYRKDAGLFSPEGESRFEIFEAAASDGVAYWTGLQHTTVRMGAGSDLQQMVLRVTEVFRRDEGAQEWKLVHRHADGQVTAR